MRDITSQRRIKPPILVCCIRPGFITSGTGHCDRKSERSRAAKRVDAINAEQASERGSAEDAETRVEEQLWAVLVYASHVQHLALKI